MALTFLVGIASALLLSGVVVAYQRAPTRVRCPECGGATKAVMPPPWLHRAAPRFQVRWCPRCSWEGLGRVGPEWVAGRRIAHDSGFHWGLERLPVDFGFRWRPLPLPEDVGVGPLPDHPSGFRFAAPDGDAVPDTLRAHPSGFAWRRPPASLETASAPGTRPDFEWGAAKAPPGFVWKEDRAGSAARRPSGFQWKGLA